jgi:hypothetical protein
VELRIEISHTAALKGIAYVYSWKTMAQKDIVQLLFNCYNGNDKKEIVSQVEQIAAFSSPFNLLYRNIFDPIVTANIPLISASSSSSQYIKYTLKKELLMSDMPYQANRDITKDVLERCLSQKTALY